MNDTPEYFLRVHQGRESTQWAEWELLARDAAYAKERLFLWEKAAISGETDIATSLFRDFVITLTSCFDKSVQVYLDRDQLFSSIPGAQEYFDWLMGLRNSWVAHRHGPARQCVAGCFADEDGNIIGFGCHTLNFTQPETEEFPQLLKMAEYTERCAILLKDRMRALAELQLRNLPPFAIKRLEFGHTTAPGEEDHEFGRAKFQKKTRQQSTRHERLRNPRDQK